MSVELDIIGFTLADNLDCQVELPTWPVPWGRCRRLPPWRWSQLARHLQQIRIRVSEKITDTILMCWLTPTLTWSCLVNITLLALELFTPSVQQLDLQTWFMTCSFKSLSSIISHCEIIFLVFPCICGKQNEPCHLFLGEPPRWIEIISNLSPSRAAEMWLR